MAPELPFEDSRRLTGGNLFFASTGAVLDTVGPPPDAALLEDWRLRVMRARALLGWRETGLVARRHARGVSLALAAPLDSLFVATEINEWAYCSALAAREPGRTAALEAALLAEALENAADPATVVPPVLEERAALVRIERLAAAERNGMLTALVATAGALGLPYTLDEEALTLGAGKSGRSFPMTALPAVDAVEWSALADIPTALVTGSNGKTTTVRLLAACARAHGWHAGYNCTDGVFLDGETLASGDYSGPAGARRVLREPRTEAAILETARGGILRRGIAVSQARVAIVTNVSSDHFGEYGIDDLEGLADAKLAVAGLLVDGGRLVLNADDALLVARATELPARFGRSVALAWFALDADAGLLKAARARGEPTAGLRAGRLVLEEGGRTADLGAIAALPLSLGGSALYNIANLAGAALGAVALGIPAATVARVFASFGRLPGDNPGRMMRFASGGVQSIVDYAHNPAGLRGLLEVAEHLRERRGRLAVLLGHAGNRQDADLVAVAEVVAGFGPELVVVKEDEAHLRGRPPGEIPRILRDALLAAGLDAGKVELAPSELEAARRAIAWARPGDVLALPVHSASARAAVLELLEQPRRR